MTLAAIALIAGIVLFETIEQYAFADGARNDARKAQRWVLGILAHVGGLLVWLPLLALLPMSVALPLTSISYVSVSAMSKLMLEEKITWRRTLAVLIIIVGVAVISFDGSWQE